MRLRSVFIGPIFFFFGREEVKSFYTSLFFNVDLIFRRIFPLLKVYLCALFNKPHKQHTLLPYIASVKNSFCLKFDFSRVFNLS